MMIFWEITPTTGEFDLAIGMEVEELIIMEPGVRVGASNGKGLFQKT